METILLVIVKRLRTIQSIDNQKATTSAIIGAEEYFNKVHNGCSETLSSKVAACAQTTYKYSGETLKGFIAQICVVKKLLFVLIGDAIRQSNAIV